MATVEDGQISKAEAQRVVTVWVRPEHCEAVIWDVEGDVVVYANV